MFHLMQLQQHVVGYIDPGAGSMLAQLFIGGATGAAYILRIYWRRISRWIPLKKKK
jgi:hypothetical protein